MGGTLDLEYLTAQLQNCGFHFDLTRTRNREGIWECRLNPHTFNHDGKWPYGRANTWREAVMKAIAELPSEVRESIEL